MMLECRASIGTLAVLQRFGAGQGEERFVSPHLADKPVCKWQAGWAMFSFQVRTTRAER
jgi:hypothetical protein